MKKNQIHLLVLSVVLLALGSFHPASASSSKNAGKILIILAHPSTDSFNHALSQTVSEKLIDKGYEVQIRDLYQLEFDPVMSLDEWKNYSESNRAPRNDVLEEQTAILWADHLVFVYPTWWWSPPAILKGYLDRVFTPNFAFTPSTGVNPAVSPLQEKTVSIIQTTGADAAFVRGEEMDLAIRKLFSVGIFGFCGMEVVHHEFLSGIHDKSYPELKQVLQEVDTLVDAWF